VEIAGELCCDSGHTVAQAVGYSLAFHLRRLPSVAASPRGVYSAELLSLYSITATHLILYWLFSLNNLVYAANHNFTKASDLFTSTEVG
jgi:hypothetical protein